MPPIVERVQVEEGFLSTLNLRFVPGLNVIIGPRGVGKTSIIELIRFCLGVKGRTEESDMRSREHARSVLGAGQVTVTLRDQDKEILVSRTANDEVPRTSTRFRPPLIFSQMEIEQVGLEARARLAIIDGFATIEPDGTREEKSLEASIRSYTLELKQLGQDLETALGEIGNLSTVPDELKAALKNQRTVLQTIKESATRQQRLQLLGNELATSAVRAKEIDQAIQDLETWRDDMRLLARKTPRLGEWPATAGPTDLLQSVRAGVLRINERIRDDLAELDRLIQQIEEVRQKAQAKTLKTEEEARVIRRELEKLKAGAGSAAQKVTSLQERAGQLQAQINRRTELTRRIEEARRQRAAVISQLEGLREKRYEFRTQVAKSLTKELGPSIEITVDQGGDAPAYVGTVQAALRGSGLHYSTLGPQLAQAMSPKELAEAVELGDQATIARLTGVGDDRAAKIIAAIARVGTEEIITASIHDRVTMSLLVGQEYRPTTDLSTGQRCTVVLSILLGYEGRGLVIDQPEDHLDNAFIVNTLIGAIQRRKKQTQLILTTHNPNIPVLGDAEMVALLGSDGQRGFVQHSGPLNDPAVVHAITTIMEGGQEAFERRATFYRSWLKTAQR
jgi:AAA domain-containing protein